MCVDTGSLRDLDHIVKRMRYTVLIQMRHCRVIAADLYWTVVPAPPAQETLTAALGHLRAHASRIQN